MKNLARAYRSVIVKNCLSEADPEERDVDYWKNYLFSKTIEMIIPLSLITLIPGIWYSIHHELYTIAFLDFLAFTLLLIAGFTGNITITNRKLLFIFNIYFIAVFLLIYVGVGGPGLLFLYAASIFGLLILSDKYTYLWSALNVLVVIGFAIVLHLNLSPVELVNEFGVIEWFAIAVNLVFLSIFSAILLPGIFKGISDTLNRQRNLQKELIKQNQEQEVIMRELKIKNEDVEQFSYVASHDLQEPLRMVSGFISQLEKKYSKQLDEKALEYIRLASDGAKRMKMLIKDLLEYSHAGIIDTKKEEIDMNKVLEDYKSLRRTLIDENNAKINYAHLPGIITFKAPLIQVIHNLLDNALKYCKNGVKPVIIVEVAEKSDCWLVSVKDNGIGIEKKFFDTIFVIFQRLHSRDQYSGTGMGLAIVRKNIESLGGEIWLTSEPQKGSVFYFRIPKQKL